jgi:hypothetical protein
MSVITPKGWTPGTKLHRFLSSSPLSYNADEHCCEAVISAGAAVKRVYGTEILEISRDAIDLSRVPCPLLDSHNQTSIDNVLGTISRAWISNGQLLGKLLFAQTPRGMFAEGMVARGELTGISAGYSVSEWSCVDPDGDAVDPDAIHWDDDLTFTATRWMLYEASLVGVPADVGSAIRSGININPAVAEARARMLARQRMIQRSTDLQGEDEESVQTIIDRVKKKHQEMEKLSQLLAEAETASEQ